MEEFRRYSSKYSFRERSETADIAVELSLQPVRRFGVDGVIMFSGKDYCATDSFRIAKLT